MRPASLLTILFLAVVAFSHLLRLWLCLPVQVGGVFVPLWMSWVAALFCGALAGFLYWETRRR